MIELVIFIGALIGIYALYEYTRRGKCEKCRVVFDWRDGSTFDTNNQADIRDVAWVRNGDMATEHVLCMKFWTNTCLLCSHVNRSVCFIASQWEARGVPFPVQTCPMCSGVGKFTVNIDSDVDLGWDSKSGFKVEYLQAREGQSKCGFCRGHGCVTKEQMRTLVLKE